MASPRALDLDREGRGWPFREASRLVAADGLRWHVQEIEASAPGGRPVLLLVHGTGSSTHSWRGLVPLLTPYFRIVAVDLPGHGFTGQPAARLFTLPGMAEGLGELLRTIGVAPTLIAGHSAGAAVMLRMVLGWAGAGRADLPKGLVSVNGALKPYGGDANRWLAPLAKFLFVNPVMPRLFAWQAGTKASVERLIRNTGSTIDPEGLEFYRVLVSNPDHVAGALGMMANWDLQPLARDLATLDVPLLVVAGSGDKAIKSEDAFAVREMVMRGATGAKDVRVEILRNLGHLAHEERPQAVAAPLLAFARDLGVLAPE